MLRIEGQVTDQVELAKQVLAWITSAERPLTTSELQYALAVEVGESELDEDNIPDIGDLVSVCAGLVTIDEESNVIRLVHYTAQEYFERTQSHWFPNAETDITTICIAYLSFDVFERGFCQSNREFEERLQSNRLFAYAAENWGYHARKASPLSPALSHAVVSFLMSEVKINSSSQGLIAIKRRFRHANYSQRVPKRVTGLHLAAFFGVEDVVKLLLDIGEVDVDSKDNDGQTPLSWACENGHAAVIKLLLETGKVNFDSKDSGGLTPLSWAALNGHIAAVKILLETGKAQPDLKDRYGRTPLLWAARKGRVAVVKLLLDTAKVDPNSKDGKHSSTPLLWATRNGHEAVVRLLLEASEADVNTKDKDNQTPLLWATRNGSQAIFKLLLETGQADVSSKDDTCKPAPPPRTTGIRYEASIKS
jgi:ankyrin repeat protein